MGFPSNRPMACGQTADDPYGCSFGCGRRYRLTAESRSLSARLSETAMASVWLHSALWLGLALLASLISIRVAISVALIEIVVGAVAGNLFSLQITDDCL